MASVLHAVAHDPENPTVVIASIHQPSSQLYHKFDQVLVLSHGRTLYNGPGGFAPSEYLSSRGIPYQQGYNVADHLLEVASDPPVRLFQGDSGDHVTKETPSSVSMVPSEKGAPTQQHTTRHSGYATTFLTQLEVISGREWKTLRRYILYHVEHACLLTL